MSNKELKADDLRFSFLELIILAFTGVFRRWDRVFVVVLSIVLGISLISALLTITWSIEFAEESEGIVREYQWWIALVSVIICIIGIANSMFLSVSERIKEIGVLKTSGVSMGQIVFLFEVEAFFFGIIGGILGIVSSGVMVYLLGGEQTVDVIQSNPDAFLEFAFPLSSALMALALVISLIGSLIPAIYGARLNLSQALVHEV